MSQINGRQRTRVGSVRHGAGAQAIVDAANGDGAVGHSALLQAQRPHVRAHGIVGRQLANNRLRVRGSCAATTRTITTTTVSDGVTHVVGARLLPAIPTTTRRVSAQ